MELCHVFPTVAVILMDIQAQCVWMVIIAVDMGSGHQRPKNAIVMQITTDLIVGISATRHSHVPGMVCAPTKENARVTQVIRVIFFVCIVPNY